MEVVQGLQTISQSNKMVLTEWLTSNQIDAAFLLELANPVEYALKRSLPVGSLEELVQKVQELSAPKGT